MSDSVLRLPLRDPPASHSVTLLEAQRDVLERIVRDQPLGEILAALCSIVEQQSERPVRAAIMTLDPDGMRLRSAAAPSLPAAYNSALDGVGIAPDKGTCCAAAARRQVIVTPDIAADPAWTGLAQLPLALGLRAAWSMPIAAASGQVLGTFGTYFFECREPTLEERQLVEVLARTAALAIERQRADEAVKNSERRHRFLTELAVATQALSDPVAVMATSANMLADELGTDRCAYAEVEDERIFVITGEALRGTPSILGRWEVAAFGPECVRCMLAGEAFVVRDVDGDERIDAASRPAYRATTIGAVICVPLLKDGRFTAAMAVHQAVPRAWTEPEIELVRLVVARCWETLERTRIARSLGESEERYRAMIEASPECVKLVRADGSVLQMNAAGLHLHEVDRPEDILGHNIYDFVAPEHRAAYRDLNERVCRGESGRLEYDLIGSKGTRRSMVSTAVPLQARDGSYVQLGMTRDVSRRVQADRALQDSRARLDYAVRLSGVGFWYCDLPFDQLRWDERVKEHFFLPPDAPVSIDDFYGRIHPEDRAATRAAIEESIAANRPYDIVYRTVRPGSDDVKWIRALGGTIYAADGTPVRFDGVTVDVTSQRLDQARLVTLNEELREQDRRKDEFLATLAHELRNPLAPIRTGLEILRTDPTADQGARVRDMMERQLNHLVRMVDDLLDISRVTLGKITLQQQHLDFHDVLRGALETARPLIEAREHALEVALPAAPLPLQGDGTRLAQVFSNLLNNAARYTPRGGRIRVDAGCEAGEIVARVSDDGLGIPADMLPRIFELFIQVRSESGTEGGLGLGLTLVQRLVGMHGGSVEAQSAGPGRGSTFTVRLPLAPTAAAA
jgi:PAS domain S-box-containing protein